ncbi:MAG: aspartate kinase, partial [Oscillospiraceae bacterium]|nr:aspartate kinase [Oscillospiraceae bacterium]
MSIVVCKFGGSSVGTFERMKTVAARIIEMKNEGDSIVAVVSAMGDTTDELLESAKKISAKNDRRELDFLMSTGEVQSAAYMAMTLRAMGEKAISLSCYQAGIFCEGNHSHARLTQIYPQRILKELDAGSIVIVAGFQGIMPNGDIATLGRGGSDTTAVALAAALEARLCKIFTDVDGIYTMDPREIKEAAKLNEISYDEMLELASLGAQVMQPRAVECAMQNDVDFEVLSTFEKKPGTLVTARNRLEAMRTISGVSHDFNVAKLVIFDVPDKPGMALRVFRELAENDVTVDMVIQSAVRGMSNDIAFTVSQDLLDQTLPIVNRLIDELGASGMSYGKDVAKVSVVGSGIKSNPAILADAFAAISEQNINIQMISTSEIKISFIVAS